MQKYFSNYFWNVIRGINTKKKKNWVKKKIKAKLSRWKENILKWKKKTGQNTHKRSDNIWNKSMKNKWGSKEKKKIGRNRLTNPSINKTSSLTLLCHQSPKLINRLPKLCVMLTRKIYWDKYNNVKPKKRKKFKTWKAFRLKNKFLSFNWLHLRKKGMSKQGKSQDKWNRTSLRSLMKKETSINFQKNKRKCSGLKEKENVKKILQRPNNKRCTKNKCAVKKLITTWQTWRVKLSRTRKRDFSNFSG